MTPDIVAALVQAGAGVATTIIFIWYLDRKDRKNDGAIERLTKIIDSVVEKVSQLNTNFVAHDTMEREVLRMLPADKQDDPTPTKPRTRKAAGD